MQPFSPLRARLASFEHAYAVAVHLRRETGRYQFIVRTGNPLQPIRVTARIPLRTEGLIALLL